MKQMKKAMVAALALAMTVIITGCGMKGATTTDKVENLIEAYQNGDVETFSTCLEEDDKLNYLMNALNSTESEGMIEVFQKVHELTKEAEITVIGENEEAHSEEYITIQIKGVDFSNALYEEMMNAINESGEEFADMPGWMMKALESGGEPFEKELDVRITSNGILYGETHNEEFLNALTGGFFPYITYTMTSCDAGDGSRYYMISEGDAIKYSLDEYYYDFSGLGYTEEELDLLLDSMIAEYDGLDIGVGGESFEDGIRFVMFIDFDYASSYTLQRLGIISGGYADYISLSQTIKSYESSGITCEKTDFGSGVITKKE